MDVYRTEEEQIAAIKKWWADNGMAVIIAIALAVAVYGGWTWYRHAQAEERLAASHVYQKMMEASEEAAQLGGGVDAGARVQRAATELVEKYPGTSYGAFGALMLARIAADADDLAGAEKHLRTALENAPDDTFTVVATDRLARVLSAQGKHGDALALLADDVPASLVGGREHTRGDILLAQGKRPEAKAAYQKALAATPEKDAARGLIQLKLDYLAGE